MTPMNIERQRIVRIMEKLGWTATRHEGGLWEFRKPDTNGWFDVIKVKQANLTWQFLMQHDLDFQKIVYDLWKETVQIRYPNVFKELPG